MLLVGFAQKAHTITRNVGRIVFLDVPVLFVDNGIIRQSLDGFVPCGMNGFIFRRSHCEQFWQTHFKTGRNVCILGQNTIVFHCQ